MYAHLLKVLSETFGVTCTSVSAVMMPTIPSGAIKIMLQVETKDLRVRFFGTNSGTYAATNGVGGGLHLPLNTINTPFYIFEGWDLINSMCIKGDDGDAKINVIYLGYEAESFNTH